jgi:hypothetical protein
LRLCAAAQSLQDAYWYQPVTSGPYSVARHPSGAGQYWRKEQVNAGFHLDSTGLIWPARLTKLMFFFASYHAVEIL